MNFTENFKGHLSGFTFFLNSRWYQNKCPQILNIFVYTKVFQIFLSFALFMPFFRYPFPNAFSDSDFPHPTIPKACIAHELPWILDSFWGQCLLHIFDILSVVMMIMMMMMMMMMMMVPWCRGVVIITTAQLHSTKPELRFCAGSSPARGMSEIRDGDDLWQWFRLEIRLNAFCQSTIPQKQFIIIIIIMKCFDGMEPLQEASPWQISDTPQAGFEACAEPEGRFSCMKLWSSDNFYSTVPQMGHTKGSLVFKTFWLGVQFGTFWCKLGGLVSMVKSIFTGFLIKFAQISSVEASKLHYS